MPGRPRNYEPPIHAGHWPARSDMRIEILESPTEQGRILDLPDGKDLTVGRGADCDVRLDDAESSRQHARFTTRADRPHIEDLDSKNGVFLNGRTILESVLSEGDQILIGCTLTVGLYPRILLDLIVPSLHSPMFGALWRAAS